MEAKMGPRMHQIAPNCTIFEKNMCSYFNRLKTNSIASSILKLKKNSLDFIIHFILIRMKLLTVYAEVDLKMPSYDDNNIMQLPVNSLHDR